MNLSEVIRRTMKRDPRSLNQLAIASGVSRGQLVRFYNADRELWLPAASKLCKALGLELRPVRRRARKGV